MDFQDISVIGISLIIAFSGIATNLLKKGKPGAIIFTKDHASLLWFRICIPLVLSLGVVFYFCKLGAMSTPVSSIYTGYIMVVFGLALRWIAILSLGNAFTVQVSILKDHVLKTDGVYKYIRHPSYTGLLIYYLGLALIMQNWVSAILLVVIPPLVVINRIRIEEQVLVENFTIAYVQYQKQSWRLLPFIF